MRIVSLLGSPRTEGNSTRMSRWLTGAAAELGAEINEYSLNDLQYRGCQACWLCKGKEERCVLQDDLSPVLDEVVACDGLVLSTPVFYGDVSSQLKAFIDRTFSYLPPKYYRGNASFRLPPGKKLVMVIAQGAVDQERFADFYPRDSSFFQWMGFETGSAECISWETP